MNFDRQHHKRIVEHLQQPGSVAHCLVYEGMIEVSPEFDQFARTHFSSIHGISWNDLCPAYALALMTNGHYRLPRDNEELETLWHELAKSDIEWSQARQVVKQVWQFLDDARTDGTRGLVGHA